MKLVITMSRRFGTGASIIAKELSEQLHIPVYDKAYIEQKINDHMYESEAEAIRKLAEKPCIILGRCASDILKDRMNVLNIFVCADKEDRIHRIMDKENLSYDEAKEKVETTDEERAARVLLWAIMRVGFCNCWMTLAMVKVLPEPVTPSKVSN